MPNVKQIEYVREIPDNFHFILTEFETSDQGNSRHPSNA